MNSGFCPDSSKLGPVCLQLPHKLCPHEHRPPHCGLTLRAHTAGVRVPSVHGVGLPSAHGGGHAGLWTFSPTCQTPEPFFRQRAVSSVWGELLLTQRWAAGAFCAGRLDGLPGSGWGRQCGLCLVREGGLRGPSPPCSSCRADQPATWDPSPRAPCGGWGFSVPAGNPQAFVGEEEMFWGRVVARPPDRPQSGWNQRPGWWSGEVSEDRAGTVGRREHGGRLPSLRSERLHPPDTY